MEISRETLCSSRRHAANQVLIISSESHVEQEHHDHDHHYQPALRLLENLRVEVTTRRVMNGPGCDAEEDCVGGNDDNAVAIALPGSSAAAQISPEPLSDARLSCCHGQDYYYLSTASSSCDNTVTTSGTTSER